MQTARILLVPRAGNPTPVELRRALSTADYVVFHALAHICADRLIGQTPDQQQQAAGRQVYRALEHGFARNACEQARALSFSDAIASFATAFTALQQERHWADCDPDVETTILGVAELSASAKLTLANLLSSSS